MKPIRIIAPLLGLVFVATGCSAGAAPNRAGTLTPVVLTLANPLSDPDELRPFVTEVDALTGGSVRIVVKDDWRRGEVNYETGLIADVKAGKADLGAAGSRAFDSAGVLSLRALHAPLLITSYAAEEQVLKSPVVADMLSGLDAAGLTGIGILPGPMRRPLGISGPLVKPADYAGRTIGTQQSKVADDTMRALGATPQWFAVGGKIDGFGGVEQQFSSIEGQYEKAAKYLTANVALWPRPFVLFAGAKSLDRLTPTQRAELKQAATASLPISMSGMQKAETEALEGICKGRQLTIEQATIADLAALRAAVQPVYDQLNSDPLTKRTIAAITAMIHGVSPEAAPACAQQTQLGSGPGSALNGVYTMTSKFGDVPGDDPVPENYGNWVWAIDGNHFAYSQQYQNLACTWASGTITVTDKQFEMTFTDSGSNPPTAGTNRPGETFAFGWSLYRDALTLTAVDGAISPDVLRPKPWHRISTKPSLAAFYKKCPPPANALG